MKAFETNSYQVTVCEEDSLCGLYFYEVRKIENGELVGMFYAYDHDAKYDCACITMSHFPGLLTHGIKEIFEGYAKYISIPCYLLDERLSQHEKLALQAMRAWFRMGAWAEEQIVWENACYLWRIA